MNNKHFIATEKPDVEANSFGKQFQIGKVVVRCLNPTTNKALHVGHLRNVSIGMAIASSHNAIGLPAATHCLLEDTGRFMAEAVAAYRADGRGDTGGQKDDQYIGSCYSAYRLGNLKLPKPSGLLSSGDIADELLEQRKLGNIEVIQTWQKIVELAVKGQSETLRNLGIAFDYADMESGEEAYLQEFVEKGCKLGLFSRTGDDHRVVQVVKAPAIKLANHFGHASESLYLLSFLYRMFTERHDIDLNIAVAGGQEWQDNLSTFASILESLGVVSAKSLYEPVFTGMVTLNGAKVASRTGHGHLIDDVFNNLAKSEVASKIAKSSLGTTTDQVAAVAMRLFFLSFPRMSDIEFHPKLLISNPKNPVWNITRAWSEVRNWSVNTSNIEDGELTSKARAVLADAATRRSFECVIKLLAEIAHPVEDAAERLARFSALRLMLSGLGVGTFKPEAAPLPIKRSFLESTDLMS